MIKILLVEDDSHIVSALSEILRMEGFSVDSALGQTKALEKAKETTYDLMLLDISLADGNGFAVCNAVREMYDVPIIFLTACDDEYSVVMGLDMGAYDYIQKPYRTQELLSRIRSVLRRSKKTQSVITIGDLSVDMDKGLVSKGGKDVFLSALEYRLFLIFLNNPKSVLSRTQLLSEIWDVAGDFVNDNTLTVYIKRLRDKIEDDPQEPKVIMTVRGLGYKLGEIDE